MTELWIKCPLVYTCRYRQPPLFHNLLLFPCFSAFVFFDPSKFLFCLYLFAGMTTESTCSYHITRCQAFLYLNAHPNYQLCTESDSAITLHFVAILHLRKAFYLLLYKTKQSLVTKQNKSPQITV